MNPLSIVQLWMAVRPFHRLKLRREARKAAEAGATPLPEPQTEHPPEHVEAVVHVAASILGGAKSKLMYLAVAQFVFGLAQLWINDGTLTALSVDPLVSGLLIGIFRISTGQTLAEKGAA